MEGLYTPNISRIFISGLVSEFVLTKPDNECIKNPLDTQGKIHLKNEEADCGRGEKETSLISPREQSPLPGDKQPHTYYIR